jgi:hypothetical protein
MSYERGAQGIPGVTGATGPAGVTGATGTEYIARGSYYYSTSSPPSYLLNNLVVNNNQVYDNLSTPLNTPDNNTYVCIQSLPNIYGAPGPLDPNIPEWVDYWQLFVSGGPTGETGPAGPTGSAPQVYQATHSKSAQQNLVSPETDVTFDVTEAWSNAGTYITQTSPTEFTVGITGLYQLEFNANIIAVGTGSSWTSLNKTISVDITRSPEAEVIAIQQSASISSGANYSQSLCCTFRLLPNDVINCRISNNFVTGATGPPYARGVTNTFDLNTFFTWRFIS